jgi:hypothetical protein
VVVGVELNLMRTCLPDLTVHIMQALCKIILISGASTASAPLILFIELHVKTQSATAGDILKTLSTLITELDRHGSRTHILQVHTTNASCGGRLIS